MNYLKNISVLFMSRGMTVISFFVFPSLMAAEDFKRYVVYFSIWQILGQVLSLQIGTTLFRCSFKSFFKTDIENALSVFYLLVSANLIISLLLFDSIEGNSTYISVAMAIAFSLFLIVNEFSRAVLSEDLVYKFQLIPGFAYFFLILAFALKSEELNFYHVVLVEILVYSAMTVSLLVISGVRWLSGCERVFRSLRRLFPHWRLISLPLLFNNAIWYFYFNVPLIVASYWVFSTEEYNSLAIVYRFFVALSTLCSMIALVFQKRIVYIHDRDLVTYSAIKGKFVNKAVPMMFLISITLSLLMYSLEEVLVNAIDLGIYSGLIYNLDLSVIFLFLIFSTYLLSHYLVAEQNLTIITPSIVTGFIVYILSFVACFIFKVDYMSASLYPLVFSVLVTLYIRYRWLKKLVRN